MIPAKRFLVRSNQREEWLATRSRMVTSTLAAKIATPSGMRTATTGATDFMPDQKYLDWGIEREVALGGFLKDNGLVPSDWLIESSASREHGATPDALSPDHSIVGEVKTTGTDWGDVSKIPIRYRRQVQWHMYVTDAESCLFVWELRMEGKHGFYSPWLEPKSGIIKRDDAIINDLIAYAQAFLSQSGQADRV